MVTEVLQEASFVQVYMALTLSIVIVHCSMIDELRGEKGTWKGSFCYLAKVVGEFINNDNDTDRLIDADILGHALRVFKKRLSQKCNKGGYNIVQVSDQHKNFAVPAIRCYQLSSILRGDRIELPMVCTEKIVGKVEVDSAIARVSEDLLLSMNLQSNMQSLSMLFLQLSQRFLDPRQAREQMELHFRLV